jgi:hypothetical protein
MKWHKYPEEKPRNNCSVLTFCFGKDNTIGEAHIYQYTDREPHLIDVHGNLGEDKDIARWIYTADIIMECME